MCCPAMRRPAERAKRRARRALADDRSAGKGFGRQGQGCAAADPEDHRKAFGHRRGREGQSEGREDEPRWCEGDHGPEGEDARDEEGRESTAETARAAQAGRRCRRTDTPHVTHYGGALFEGYPANTAITEGDQPITNNPNTFAPNKED